MNKLYKKILSSVFSPLIFCKFLFQMFVNLIVYVVIFQFPKILRYLFSVNNIFNSQLLCKQVMIFCAKWWNIFSDSLPQMNVSITFFLIQCSNKAILESIIDIHSPQLIIYVRQCNLCLRCSWWYKLNQYPLRKK